MTRRSPSRARLAVLAQTRPWLASMGKCRSCGGDLIDVARCGVHPDPDCDPDGLTDLTPAELAELEAKYVPPRPELTGVPR